MGLFVLVLRLRRPSATSRITGSSGRITGDGLGLGGVGSRIRGSSGEKKVNELALLELGGGDGEVIKFNSSTVAGTGWGVVG